MTEALAVAPNTGIATTDKNIYESLALRGDMSMLSPQDKASYLQKLCESLGLNPYTQPFTPLKLNGKEVLYASRGATDQLASINKLTREIIKTEKMEDVYIAVCKVTAPDGRFDISTGVVTIGNLKSDALANALMKAETKAKRRATLSFCGLGFLDESELETIPADRMQPVPQRLTKNQLAEATRVENAKPVAEAPKPDASIKQYHLDRQMREEIIKLAKAINTDATEGLAYFDANPDMRSKCLTKVRRTFIKTSLVNAMTELSDEGKLAYLEDFGITAIDSATDEQIESCATTIFTQFYTAI